MLTKKEIREKNKSARLQICQAAAEEKSSAAAKAFLASEMYKKAQRIMLYMPIGNEMNTADIIKAVFADGKEAVFPVTEKDSGIITPYYAAADTVFKKGSFSVEEPQGTAAADISKLDIVLVPGIAFDKNGARIGFGKGCYDMFFKGLDTIKVGVCYDFQLRDKIPAEEHDIKMDFLLTESGLKRCGE